MVLTEKTRTHPGISVGISTRGAMALLDLSKTLAWIQGRDYVIPEDIKLMAPDVLLHRIQLKSGAETDKGEVLRALFAEIPAIQ